MTEPVLAELVCRRCGAALDAANNFCCRCGRPTGQQPQWWESPWMVLPMLFLVLGPLALPMLWRSRRFTRPWKWVLTILVTMMTLFLLWVISLEVQQTLKVLRALEKPKLQ
jgi:hypothetical protein